MSTISLALVVGLSQGDSYKQNKFNLLREQSEGYSKLTTELTSSLGPPHSPATGYPVESVEMIEARARPTWERALGLIGYFDLDPNRALDIILDVFSVHLATHYSFFLSLLSFSPWGGRARRPVKQEDMSVEPDPERYRGKTLTEVLKIAEQQAGVRPDDIDSNQTRVLAQVLGFKFTYYQVGPLPKLDTSLSLTGCSEPRRSGDYPAQSIPNGRYPDQGRFPLAGGSLLSCASNIQRFSGSRLTCMLYRLVLQTTRWVTSIRRTLLMWRHALPVRRSANLQWLLLWSPVGLRARSHVLLPQQSQRRRKW